MINAKMNFNMNIEKYTTYYAKCPFCGQAHFFDHKKDIKEWIRKHEGKDGKACQFNPVNKLCGSCKHYMSKFTDKCIPDNKYVGSMFIMDTCNSWECKDELKEYIKE